MLISGDDISNDVITLSTCFSMFVYIRTHFHFTLIGGNLTGQLIGSHRDEVGSSPSFSHPATRVPQRACSQAMKYAIRNKTNNSLLDTIKSLH